ncbi:hypothetical protein [Marinimicrococcus flavescens]|uniref:Uncharacterized protein n=1 Tax=Marinimicrococcus flavescens TaxID=3031815 RepID=A0AAP3XTE8_9PROT|nr:hypothetical protein [Marinimicrococcus flavescens]
MAASPAAALEDLRERLGVMLGRDTLLYRRFATALRRRDPELLAAASDSLRLYPPSVRRRVEKTLAGWLLETGAQPACTDPAMGGGA